MQRPALIVALCYLCGLLAGHYLSPPLGALCTGTIAAGLLAVGLRRRARTAGIAACSACLALAGAGAFWYAVRTRVIPLTDISRYGDRAESIVLEGTVASDPDVRARYTLVTLAAHRAVTGPDSTRMTGRVLVRLQPGIAPGAYGDTVRVSGRLRRPAPARNPGGFDARAYYTQRGIRGLMSVRDPGRFTLVARRTRPTFHTAIIRPLKHHIERTIDATLRGASAALLKGILLGQRARIPEDVLTAFSSIGLTHVLAVSGLHVGLITLIATTLFSLIRLPRPYATLATLIVLALYACITNLTPSVVRASIMAGLFLIGITLDRQTDAVNILSVAALVILLLWPQAVFDLSFQLSFIATLSILLGYARFTALLPAALRRTTAWWKRWLVDGFGVSLAAQLGTLPVIASTFFKVSLISPLANLFVGPFVFVSTTLGVITVIVGTASLEAARLFGAANWLSLQAMMRISALFAALPYASIPAARPALLLVLTYYSLLLLFLASPRFLTVRRGVVLLLLAGALNLGWQRRRHAGELVITVLDVGQGDAIFVECPGGYDLLIDGGLRTPDFDAGARIVLPFLRSKGIRHIDTIVVSHPHQDHYGGLPAVLSAVPANRVVTSGLTSDAPSFRDWLDTVRTSGARRRVVSAGDSLRGMGEVHGVFLHPTPPFAGRDGPPPGGANNASVVLRLAYRTFSILLTGDVEGAAEQRLLARRGALHSTVIKVPHHGSDTSSSRAFVEAVRPRAAVISVGARNKFGHPSPRVIALYRATGAQVHRTDLEGGIVIRSDGQAFYIEPTLKSGDVQGPLTPAQALRRICLTPFFTASIFR